MFIAALFTIAKLWKQPRSPTTDDWIKKMWYKAPIRLMGRRRQANCTPQKNNSIEDLVGNEENEYLAPDPKTIINVTNELSDTHKKTLKVGNHGQVH
jgi:hypothetical protein